MRAVLVALLLASSSAYAETATELFEQGLALLDAGNPAEACTKLESALRLEPGKPGIVLNLGVCNAKQNKTATALVWFRRALALAVEGSMAEVETVAKEQIKALSAKVAWVSLAVSPSDATVTLDGAPVPATTFARLELDPGQHTLDVTAAGYMNRQLVFRIEDGGTSETITVELTPTPKSSGPAVDVPPSEHAHPGRSKRIAGIVIGGVGVAALVTGTVFAFRARSLGDDVTSTGDPQDPPVFDPSDQDRGKRAQLFATIGWISGGALVATGVVLYMLGAQSTDTRVGIAPTSGGSALVFAGSF